MTLDECLAKANGATEIIEAARAVIEAAEKDVDELAGAINGLADAVRDCEAAIILATTRPAPAFESRTKQAERSGA